MGLLGGWRCVVRYIIALSRVNAMNKIQVDRPGAVVLPTALFGSLTDLENRRDKLISRSRFIRRMLRAIGVWWALASCGLLIGMAGYSHFESMSLPDAYVNAAMILSGMGPLGELRTTPGKIFAGTYAILSGLIIVIATSFVLAPIFHRVLHHFHVETEGEG